MVKAEIVLVDGDVFEVDLATVQPTLDSLFHCVNQHPALKKGGMAGEGSQACWRLVDEEGAIVRTDADAKSLLQGGAELITLLGMTRSREAEDDEELPSNTQGSVDGVGHFPSPPGGSPDDTSAGPPRPTSGSPMSSPSKRDSSQQVGSSPSGIRDDERSISIQERVTHKSGWLPQQVKDQLLAMPEGDVLPYNAACRLAVELHGEVFYVNLCTLMEELERDLHREDEAKAAKLKNEAKKEEKKKAAAEGGDAETGGDAEKEEETVHDVEELSARLMSMIPPTETLGAMGFDDLAILRCMLDSQLREEEALNRMLSVPNPEQFSTPLSDDDVLRYAVMYGLITLPTPDGGNKEDGAGEEGESGGQSGPTEPFDPKLAQLMEMGFSRAEAKKALRGAGGDVDEAAAALLGDPVALERGRQRTAQTSWYTELEDEIRERNIEVETVLMVAKGIMNDPNCIADLWAHPKARVVMKLLLKNFSSNQR